MDHNPQNTWILKRIRVTTYTKSTFGATLALRYGSRSFRFSMWNLCTGLNCRPQTMRLGLRPRDRAQMRGNINILWLEKNLTKKKIFSWRNFDLKKKSRNFFFRNFLRFWKFEKYFRWKFSKSENDFLCWKNEKNEKIIFIFFSSKHEKIYFLFHIFFLRSATNFRSARTTQNCYGDKVEPCGGSLKNFNFDVFHDFSWIFIWSGAPIGISPSFGHFGSEIFVTGSQKGSKTHYKLDSRPRVAGSIKYTYNSINK